MVGAPLWPLLAKELREITNGRALWTILLLLCLLVGYSFFQAVSLYGEASTAALQSPVLANSLSPLDGILVPTLGSFYVAVTLLFPFVSVQMGLAVVSCFRGRHDPHDCTLPLAAVFARTWLLPLVVRRETIRIRAASALEALAAIAVIMLGAWPLVSNW
ncbi:hypothetical protein [Bradyrhizobium sp. sBnM-33]|uniref:hypothetical protein n=1 Tax=Bradyrhizobium sp. sBnM-33 TaxID=2831780 RepID=UPI0020BF9D7B|nr:hypothetical protein [Bradyrhizobium sp. sBnM-33]WOH48697.1 hypothetical protein RX328_32070 [Bradyrhizobium sp. sBnM-33]